MTNKSAPDAQKPISFDLSPYRALLLTLITGLLRAAGAALVTHGWTTQATIDGAVGPVAQQILGVLLLAGGQAWAWWREKRHNDKIGAVFADDKTTIPPEVATLK